MDAVNAMRRLVKVIDAKCAGDQEQACLYARQLIAELGCREILNNPLPEWIRQRNG